MWLARRLQAYPRAPVTNGLTLTSHSSLQQLPSLYIFSCTSGSYYAVRVDCRLQLGALLKTSQETAMRVGRSWEVLAQKFGQGEAL